MEIRVSLTFGVPQWRILHFSAPRAKHCTALSVHLMDLFEANLRSSAPSFYTFRSEVVGHGRKEAWKRDGVNSVKEGTARRKEDMTLASILGSAMMAEWEDEMRAQQPNSISLSAATSHQVFESLVSVETAPRANLHAAKN